MSRYSTLASSILVASIAGAIYVQTLTYEFLPEDAQYVYETPAIASTRGFARVLSLPVPPRSKKTATYYRPIVMAAFWTDYQIWGNRPAGFHLTNVLLHILAASGLYRILCGLGFGVYALLGALLFAAHPVHAQTVCFVSARMEIFAALFAAFCFRWYLAGGDTISRGPWPRLCSLACFALAVLSKESAITFPAVLFAWDAMRPSARAKRTRSLPFWALGAAYVALRLTVLFPLRIRDFAQADWPRPVEGLLRAAGLILRVAWWPKNLYIDYPVELISPTVAVILIAATVLLCCLGRMAVRSRWLLDVGWVWVAAGLIPLVAAYWGRASVDIDSYLYLPAMGAALYFACLMRSTLGRSRIGVGLLILAVCEFAALTLHQCCVWAAAERTVQMKKRAGRPGEPETDLNLAIECVQTGRLRAARRLCRKLVAVPAAAHRAKLILATCAMQEGDFSTAEKFYRSLLKENPDDAMTQLGLASALTKQRKFDEATSLVNALARSGRWPFHAVLLLGDILQARGDIEGAVQMFKRAASMNVPEEGQKIAAARLRTLRAQTQGDAP